MDWDDIRIFLAVARHGSLRAAGRALGLSQPTVGRRLAAFEKTFGGPALFDRLPDGLRLNAAGEALVAAAERLETAALALERRRVAASPTLSGTVRVSVGEWAEGLLARHSGRAHADGSAAGDHPRTRRVAADREPGAPRRRSGAAPRRARGRQSVCLQGRRDRRRALPPARRRPLRPRPRRALDHLHRGAGPLRRARAGSTSISAAPAAGWCCAPPIWRCGWKRSAPASASGCCRAMRATATRCSSG